MMPGRRGRFLLRHRPSPVGADAIPEGSAVLPPRRHAGGGSARDGRTLLPHVQARGPAVSLT